METKEYIAPKIEVVEIEYEGTICESPQKETINISNTETGGEWDD